VSVCECFRLCVSVFVFVCECLCVRTCFLCAAIRDIHQGEQLFAETPLTVAGTTKKDVIRLAMSLGLYQHKHNQAPLCSEPLQQNEGLLELIPNQDPDLISLVAQTRTNMFSAVVNGKQQFHLVPTLSRLNHSCCPNVSTYRRPDSMHSLHALQAIKQGEELLICYHDAWLLLPRSVRHKRMQHSHNFKCKCGRCEGKQDAGDKLLTQTPDHVSEEEVEKLFSKGEEHKTRLPGRGPAKLLASTARKILSLVGPSHWAAFLARDWLLSLAAVDTSIKAKQVVIEHLNAMSAPGLISALESRRLVYFHSLTQLGIKISSLPDNLQQNHAVLMRMYNST